MKTRPLALALCAVAALLTACGNPVEEKENPPPELEVAKSNLPRAVSPAVPASDLDELVAGNQAFALDLYRALREPGKNLLTSPHSVSTALAMAWAGARGETESQTAAALHFTLPQERLHAALNGLDQLLASRGQGASGKDGLPFRLSVVNAAWGERTYQFEQPYLDTLAVNYGAGLNLLDFAGAPEASRTTINDWVAYQTEDRIRDLLPEGSVTSLTRLVLTNAVYFNAAWAEPFATEATSDQAFTLLDGTQVQVPTMHASLDFKYAEGADWKAVELPYDGGELSMIALRPAGDLTAFEDGLDSAKLDAILAALTTQTVDVALPRFSFEWDSSLRTALRSLGMEEAFDDAKADFSGINGGREALYISDVVHKTFIGLDEAGTEAAAATGVILAGRGPDEVPEITLDKPFVFLIRDVQTGAVVFLGRVVDPR